MAQPGARPSISLRRRSDVDRDGIVRRVCETQDFYGDSRCQRIRSLYWPHSLEVARSPAQRQRNSLTSNLVPFWSKPRCHFP